MGICISKNSVADNTLQTRNSVKKVQLISFNRLKAKTNLTEADEEQYTPKPPTRTRDELIPDFTVFNSIDQHSKSAPVSVRSSISDLATYLIQPCTTDVDIVRAFYIWICYNISYDTESLFSGSRKPQDSETVLRTGLSVCQGYSDIFASLCRAVGIPVKCLSGYSKGFGYNPEKKFNIGDKTGHAWNAVFVQNEWRLIETTWGSGHLGGTQFVRHVTNRYFFMEPRKMINAHYPFIQNDQNISNKWQLLTSPLSMDRFNDDVKLDDEGLDWEVELNPKHARLKVSRMVQITVSANNMLLVNIKVVVKKNGSTHTGFLFVQQVNKGIFKTTFRPTNIGKYDLHFYGNISNGTGSFASMCTMSLNVTDSDKNLSPYPDFDLAYGACNPLAQGLTETMRYGKVYVSSKGQIDIPVETQIGTKLLHGLKHSESDIKDAKSFAFPERKSDTLTIFHLRLPLCGFYQFKIFTQLPEEIGNQFNTAATYLVECVQPTNLGPYPAVYEAANELGCNLVKPNIKYIQANSSVEFEVFSKKLVIAKVKAGSTNFPMSSVNNCWKCTVKSGSPGEDIMVYGNNTSGSLQGLYKFTSVS